MSERMTKTDFRLGFGLMRLPKLEDGHIDVQQTAEMVDLIMEGRAFDLAFEFSGALSDLPYLFRKQLDANNVNIASAFKKIEKSLTKNAPKQINKMYGD